MNCARGTMLGTLLKESGTRVGGYCAIKSCFSGVIDYPSVNSSDEEVNALESVTRTYYLVFAGEQ